MSSTPNLIQSRDFPPAGESSAWAKAWGSRGWRPPAARLDISQFEFEKQLGCWWNGQWLWKENRALAACLHHAQFKIAATLEHIDYRHSRGLKRAQIKQLRALDWVAKHHNNWLITSQFPVNQWHEIIADATLDRLVHEAYSLELKGESIRKARPASTQRRVRLLRIKRGAPRVLDAVKVAQMVQGPRRCRPSASPCIRGSCRKSQFNWRELQV